MPDFDPSKELVVNHLENNREITTKTGLIRSLKAYYKDNIQASKYHISQRLFLTLCQLIYVFIVEYGYQLFDTTPTTFVVSSNLDTYEYH